MLTENYELTNLTLSEIVKDNFRTASIFEKYNLDFCCNGKRTLADACTEKGINSENIINEIKSIGGSEGKKEIRPNDWQLDFLVSYIVNNHHSYVNRMLPVISAHIQKVASKHGENHPETKKIAEIFALINVEMKHHMMKEERILFPHIIKLVGLSNNGIGESTPYFGTIKNPIAMIEAEHQSAGDGMSEIRNLTNNYTPPDDACETYKISFKELKEFEEDLHKHVHLENNILFPKAIKLEESLFGKQIKN
jgi:regulator of cell morphogenesis and NO signaling